MLEKMESLGVELHAAGYGTVQALAKDISLTFNTVNWGDGLRIEAAWLSGPGLTRAVDLPGLYGDDGRQLRALINAFRAPNYGSN